LAVSDLFLSAFSNHLPTFHADAPFTTQTPLNRPFSSIIKLLYNNGNFLLLLITDHRSILANTDWKKLWMETGQLMNRIDNNIDSSDSTLPEESEVSVLGGAEEIQPRNRKLSFFFRSLLRILLYN
jgi:hypothetical protein